MAGRRAFEAGWNSGIGAAGTAGTRPRADVAAAKLEVGGIEGAGVPTRFAAGVNPVDQLPGKLRGGHPDIRDNGRILVRKFGLQPYLTQTFRHGFKSRTGSGELELECDRPKARSALALDRLPISLRTSRVIASASS